MSYRKLNHEDLLRRLKSSREKEKELIASILTDLLEVEARGLHLARGFSSMYSFCREELGYSETETMLRLNAMRLMRAVPEVKEKIESGSLSLTNAAEVGRQIKKEEKRLKKPLRREEKLTLVTSVENTSARECQRELARALPDIQAVAEERLKVLKDENTLVQFVASPELMKKLERLKELLAHKNFSGRYDLLFEELADLALRKLKQDDTVAPSAPMVDSDTSTARVIQTSACNADEPSAPMVPQMRKSRSRFIRIGVKREAMKRAKDQCEYVDHMTGRRCESRHGLEFDHIVRFKDGGANDLENLRVLCDAHNRGRERFPRSLFELAPRESARPV